MTEQERHELIRRASLESAIGSGELEGVTYTPEMRDLLDRSSRGVITEEEFDREVLAMAHA